MASSDAATCRRQSRASEDSGSSSSSDEGEADSEHLQFTLALLGPRGAGKTCLAQRVAHGTFNPRWAACHACAQEEGKDLATRQELHSSTCWFLMD